MKRRIAAFVAAVATVAGLTAGCSGQPVAYYDTLCVNPITQIRMPDVYCLIGNPLYHSAWVYYVPVGYVAPAYGVHITHYNVHNYTRPARATIHAGGVPSSGGKATRFKTGNVSVKPPSRKAPPPDKVSRKGTSYKPKSRFGGGSVRIGSRSGRR